LSRTAAFLILLSFLTFFIGLGRPAIGDADEAYYAEAAREMVDTGDLLTPHYNYADRWQKPVLFYWVTAATYFVTGPSEWSARSWSALSGIGLVLLTWAIARRTLRREDTAWLAGAIVATCYGYFFMARQALPDLPLAFFITLTIWSTIERRWTLAAVAAGLGFLTKGPVALIVPAVVLVPVWWHERSWPTVADLAVAAIIFGLVGLPWYLAMTLRHGTPYLESFFVGDNLERFATTRFNGPRFVLYYVPIVIGGMLPWAMYLLVLPWRRGIDVLRRRQRLAVEEWRLVAWAVAPLVFFTLSVGKQPRYILPVLPPLAILVAQSISKRLAPADDASRGERALAVATWLTAGTLMALAALLVRARPLFITAYPLLTVVSVLALIVCSLVTAAVVITRRWSRLPLTLTAVSAVTLLALQFGALSGVRPEPVEQMTALIRAHRSSEPIGEYRVFVRNMVFYVRDRQTELFTDAGALDFMKSPRRALLVVRNEDLQRLEQISGQTWHRLGEVRYVDTATIRLRALLWPIPEEDVDRVFLVANQ